MRQNKSEAILKLSIFYFTLLFSQSIHAQITVSNLQCEYRSNPMGIDIANPTFSWGIEASKRNIIQSAYRVLVSDNLYSINKNEGNIWDSRKINGSDFMVTLAGAKLLSARTYYWKVQIWSNDQSAWSKIEKFVTGLITEESWSGAKWITAPLKIDTTVNNTSILRRDFEVKKGLKRANIFICGLGQYEITLNGIKPTETVLNPGWTEYNKTCLYDSYDITSFIHPGENTIGVLLGNGMYRVAKGRRYAKFERSFGRLQAIAKIQFEYNDGAITTLVTDGQWHAGISPMTFSSVYGGEDWDARKLQMNWDKPGFNASSWVPVEILQGPGGTLKGITHAAPAIQMFEVHKPITQKEIKPNVFIYDLGQSASHMARFSVHGPSGSVVKITPDELLMPDGSLFKNNYNGRSYSQYILAGNGKENYTTKFFYYGCRYYQVECIPAAGSTAVPAIDSLEGVVVHSSAPGAGEFSCSNELFNKIYKMIHWAEVSNMMSVISDCPHRERLGWLEQDHLHGPSFRYGFDMNSLVNKIINDIEDSQLDNGLMPTTAPEYPIFPEKWRDAIEWGSAGILLPWQQYQWTGDIGILRKNYPMMKRYVDHLSSRAKDNIAAVGLGDWSGKGPSPETAKDLIATAFYYGDVDVLAKSAKLLGDVAEASRKQMLAKSIRETFNKTFFHSDSNQYGTGSQCANAMALVMGLVETENERAVLNNLVDDIEKRKYELTTGEIGYRYVIKALADGGRSDVVYNMNNQSEKPGYGYQLKMGATALPETWNADRDNSQIQFMLGHIIEWFYHDLAGIQMDEIEPGFGKIIIHPNIVGDLSWVKGSYKSIRGRILSEWKKEGKKLFFTIEIPVNTVGTILLPANTSSFIREGGTDISKNKDIIFLGNKDGVSTYKVGSGIYNFEVIN